MKHDEPRRITKAGANFAYARKLRHAIIGNKPGGSLFTRTAHTVDGVFVQAEEPDVPPASAAGSATQRFRIQSVAPTYLTAVMTDGTNDQTDLVYIAFPLALRDGAQSSTNANPTRTVRVSGVDGVEEITPAYAVNGVIWAQVATGKTGVFAQISGVSTELEWIDMNLDARTWQFPRRVVEVCVNNTTRRMIIRGSAPA